MTVAHIAWAASLYLFLEVFLPPTTLDREKVSTRYLICAIIRTCMKLFINSRDELRILELNDVVYMKASGNYTDFHFRNMQTISEISCLSYFEQQISMLYGAIPSPFLRVGRSYLVNINYITNINIQRQSIKFSTTEALTLPKHRIRQLKEHIVRIQENHSDNNP